MEAYYFAEELPLALQYGMTPKQFWEDDIDLIFVYQKAYTNKIHTEAHINALYNEMALEIAMANSFKKPSDKRIDFPQTCIYNPYEQKRDTEQSQANTSMNTADLFHIKRKIINNSHRKEE